MPEKPTMSLEGWNLQPYSTPSGGHWGLESKYDHLASDLINRAHILELQVKTLKQSSQSYLTKHTDVLGR